VCPLGRRGADAHHTHPLPLPFCQTSTDCGQERPSSTLLWMVRLVRVVVDCG
jgi:hypothetical protein